MSRSRRSALVAALVDPATTLSLGPREWHDLLMTARKHGLLARLAAEFRRRGIFAQAPTKARSHMIAAEITSESTQTAIRFEIQRVLRALGAIDVPIVLLKGAAYVMAELPPAQGRMVGDLDLMVPRERIDEVEYALMSAGWIGAELDEYDQRYYREWAHEIPPLQHEERETIVDVHHTIAPLTSRVHPDAAALFAASMPLGDSRLRVLGPADMVLHSTVHLFNDDVGKPLRDLVDLGDLLAHYGTRPEFWGELVERAGLHRLGRPLYYMLRQTERVLGRTVPPHVMRAVDAWGPAPPLRFVMDRLFEHRFADEALGPARAGAALASRLLYVRSHWLRMPFVLLVRHLSIKAIRRFGQRFERKPENDDVPLEREGYRT